MNTFNPNNCHAINIGGKRKGLQCGNPKGNLTIEDGHYLCNNHLKMWKENMDSFQFVTTTTQQQLIPTLEAEASIPKGPSPAHIIAARFGLQKASDLPKEVEANGGPVARAYINKIPKEDHTMKEDEYKFLECGCMITEEDMTNPNSLWAHDGFCEKTIDHLPVDYDPKEDHVMTNKNQNQEVRIMLTDVHGDHGQPNATYESLVGDMQQELYEEEMDQEHAARRAKEEAEENASTQKPLHIIVFTGHRPTKLGGYDPNPLRTKVKKAMLKEVNEVIAKYGDTHEVVIIWGGALGVDQWAAHLANHLGLRHTAFLPFEGFDVKWPKSSRDELAELLTTCAKVRYISEPGYSAKKMMDRNIAMIDKADTVIAVWDGSSGGTSNAVGYARNRKANLVIIDPTAFVS